MEAAMEMAGPVAFYGQTGFMEIVAIIIGIIGLVLFLVGISQLNNPKNTNRTGSGAMIGGGILGAILSIGMFVYINRSLSKHSSLGLGSLTSMME